MNTPWRVLPARPQPGFGWQVWTAEDNTPGSRNNYVVADDIQDEDQANLLASAPVMLQALKAIAAVFDGTQPKDIPGALMVAQSAIAAAEGKQ